MPRHLLHARARLVAAGALTAQGETLQAFAGANP
jgi:hypothetical protein